MQDSLPKPPDHLDDLATAKWSEIVEFFVEDDNWTPAIADAVAAYAQAWSRWSAAEKAIRETGTMIKAPSGYLIQSPQLAIANKAIEHLLKWSRLLSQLTR